MKRRLYSTVALMIVTVLALGVGAVSHVAATTIVSSYYNGNGHGGVTFNLNTKLTFNGYSTNWNPTYAESYMKVTNA